MLRAETAMHVRLFVAIKYAQVMVISLGAGTHVFQLDRALGEFVLTNHCIKMPTRGKTRDL